MTKRADIVSELLSRLMALNLAPRRELPASEEGPYPAVYLFEDVEFTKLIKPGLYEKKLALWIEYHAEVASVDLVYQYGNILLGEIQAAVEIDERFAGLCIQYGMRENTLAPVGVNALGLLICYDFTYVEEFKGYEPKRH